MNFSLPIKSFPNVLILLICTGLLVCGCSPKRNLDDSQSAPVSNEKTTASFQEYLWYENPVILLLHIAVMLAGAIGVTALLPAPYEEEKRE